MWALRVGVFCVIGMLCSVAGADRPRVIDDYMRMRENVGRPFTNVALPVHALGRDDVDRWSRLLIASEAQRNFMLEEYAHFVQRHNEFMDREAPRYLDASAQLGLLMQEAEDNLPPAEAMKDLRRRSTAIRSQLEQIEIDYIDSLEPILADEQVARLEVLRHEATRRQLRPFRNNVRWADVELREVWIEMKTDPLPPATIAQVESILGEFESQLPPLMLAQSEAMHDWPIVVVPLIARHRRGEVSDEAFGATYRRVAERYLNAGLRIRALTQATMEQVVALLPADVSDAFVLAVKRRVYPELYPDGTSLDDLFAAIVAEPELSEETRSDVALLHAEYIATRTRLHAEMEAMCLRWGDGGAAGDSNFHDAKFPAALEPLLERRREMSRAALQALRERIGDEVIELHAQHIPSLETSPSPDQPWLRDMPPMR